MADADGRRVAVVLVLGDVGRSPRMQYHALSLARAPAFRRVFLVGHHGERAMPALEAEGKIMQVRLASDMLPRPRRRSLYLLYASAKSVLQLAQLMWTLLVSLPCVDVLLLQTPPAVPALAAAWAVRAVRGGSVIVDWHNLGFSVLRHALRPMHPFVRLCFVYECIFGRLLDGHLCVTNAMSRWLAAEWGLSNVRVLHDRPPVFFRRIPPSERHELFRRLRAQFVDAHDAPLWPADGDDASSPWANGGTPWTEERGGALVEKASRPALLISSTSWTADEDFELLLQALAVLDTRLGDGYGSTSKPPHRPSRGPIVVAVITGKGPLKAHYEERMRALGLRRVAICTMWLAPADYPRLLGSADLGVCLHTSTSGLDLPMKVLDMFGCGLPVCAVAFPCLDELVVHAVNGLTFRESGELAEHLEALLAPTAEADNALRALREGVAAFEARRPRWAENWEEAAAPLLLRPCVDGAAARFGRFAALGLMFGLLAVAAVGVASMDSHSVHSIPAFGRIQ